MAWLTAILSWLAKSNLAKLALDYLWGKLTAWFEILKRQKEIDEKIKAQAEALKKAQTEEELEQAAKDILGRK